MADKKISELDQALQINNDAVFPISQDNGGTDTTYKVSITQISAEIGEDQTFSNLDTTDKTLVGAINEIAQGGGGTTDYEDLSNKPQVNSVELVGNTSLDDLGIMPASLSKTVSGSIAHITDGGDNIPVKSLVSEIVAVETGNGQPKSPTNPYTISGFDSGIITVTDNDQITNTYTFTFGQTVYGGHFDNKGNLVVTRVCKRLTTAYNMSGAYQGSIIYNVSSEETSDADFTKPIMCNNLQYVGTSLSNFVYGTCINYLGASFNLWLKNGAFSDLAEATQWLADNPTYICYYLATPITLAITSQDIPTLLGENNIFSNCGDVEVEYFTEKANAIAELIKAFM